MDNTDKIDIGRVVRSVAGRDKDRYFIIVGIPEEKGYVLLADGVLRKLSNPKKKKIKHIKPEDAIIDTVVQKTAEKKKIFDSELRKCLEQFSTREEG